MGDEFPQTCDKWVPSLTVAPSQIDGNGRRQILIRSHVAQVTMSDADTITIAGENGVTAHIIGASTDRSSATSILRWTSDQLEEVMACDDLRHCLWESEATPLSVAEVASSYQDNFYYIAEDIEAKVVGLRPPQLGAIHAVLGYWSTNKGEPATVVMPTGTGKTEVMIALLAAAQIKRLLILVPSDALRMQLGEKFLDLGILQECGVIHASCHRPIVGLISSGFSSAKNARDFALGCNVIVATPDALMASGEEQRAALLDQVDCLFVDEAHHVVADTWFDIRKRFANKRVVQFTATPYREDKKSVGGKIIYDFPLREAQRLGYFKKINYRAVVDFADEDGAIARTAVAQLDADLAAGKNHLLMARVRGINRARDILKIYQSIAPGHKPVIMHSKLSPEAKAAGLAAMKAFESRIIVCVDMLGEGFDLPELKIAAIHDPHKSLGITLQFIGRFARSTGDDLGEATVVVARPKGEFDQQIRKLYAEDADWNQIVADLSESAINNEESVKEFEEGFTGNPLDIDMQGISPKMSTVVYRVTCDDWDPDGVTKVYSPDVLVTFPYSVNEEEKVLWFVTQHAVAVPWAVSNPLEDVVYELFIAFYDSESKLLFVNSSHNEGHHEELAKALCGAAAVRVQGQEVYRAFANINFLVPTNIGTRDIRNHNRSHTMHAGANVTEGLTAVDSQTKMQTNLFGKGYENGLRSSVGVSMKGRIWSFQEAYTIKHWVDWCRAIGQKVTDDSISIDEVMKSFIRPKPAEERPELVALAIEWPDHIITNISESLRFSYNDIEVPILDTALEVREFNASGPVKVRLRNEHWALDYDIEISKTGMHVRAIGDDATVLGTRFRSSASDYLTHYGLHIQFENETVVNEQCLLLVIDRELDPYPKDALIVLNWDGINLKRESQGRDRDQTTVQARTLQRIESLDDWDIILDDDSAYETADIVALKATDGVLRVHLTHCKFSSEETGGARIGDLYEVCGQAMKSVVWRNKLLSMMENLRRREQNRQTDKGFSGFIKGDGAKLLSILDSVHRMKRVDFTIAISQPGLSADKVSDDQLQLLASTHSHVRDFTSGTFEVYCNT